MSNISKTFKKLRAQGRKAFIPYIMAGYPSVQRTKELIKMLEECGADIIELGVPFTDPMADGPVIQRAAEGALREGVTLRKVIELVREIRTFSKTPIVLMTYYNPVFKYGEELFIKDASLAGVDGLIIPDLPPDEAGNLIKLARKSKVDTIFMLAPTSTPERVKIVAKASRGFIYYVPITGITGARLQLQSSELNEALSGVRAAASVPVCVGFGVSTPEEARNVAATADGVIVGSAIVKRLGESEEELRAYIKSLRGAI